MKLWFIGVSIYPVSYVLSVIIKLFGTKSDIFAPPTSLPFWYLLTFSDFLLNCFGVRVWQPPHGTVWFDVYLVIIMVLVAAISAIFFVLISSILPKNRKSLAIVILYILLVAINSYAIDINF